MDSILVACVGNIFLGDDGFGVEVAQHLKRREAPAGVRIEDFGIVALTSPTLLMDPWHHVVLVDAMDLGGAPGDVSVVPAGPGTRWKLRKTSHWTATGMPPNLRVAHGRAEWAALRRR